VLSNSSIKNLSRTTNPWTTDFLDGWPLTFISHILHKFLFVSIFVRCLGRQRTWPWPSRTLGRGVHPDSPRTNRRWASTRRPSKLHRLHRAQEWRFSSRQETLGWRPAERRKFSSTWSTRVSFTPPLLTYPATGDRYGDRIWLDFSDGGMDKFLGYNWTGVSSSHHWISLHFLVLWGGYHFLDAQTRNHVV